MKESGEKGWDYVASCEMILWGNIRLGQVYRRVETDNAFDTFGSKAGGSDEGNIAPR
jgi:hypothetical protein